MHAAQHLGLLLPPDCDARVRRTAEVIARQVGERSPARAVVGRRGGTTVDLCIDSALPSEGLRIEDASAAEGPTIRISGADLSGLLYGAGRFLHTSHHIPEGIVPSPWRGTAAPDCPVRGIYMATHFNNFYEAAPADEVQRYVEDLALWGVNCLLLHFPTSQYAGMNDPAARANLEQIRGMMRLEPV